MNNIFELLKMINSFNQPQSNQVNSQNNSSFNNYPNEAFNQSNSTQNQHQSLTDSLLPLLMSILGKNTDISKAYAQNTNNTKDETNNKTPSPKDELLL